MRTSLVTAAVCAITGALLTRRCLPPAGSEEDLTPTLYQRPAGTEIDLDLREGPVLVTVEYLIDPARTDEFLS